MDFARASGFLTASHEGVEMVPRVKVAESFWLRGLGLMGKAAIPPGYGAGLLFANCRSLHTCFMRFPLDVLFLDAAGQPVGVRRNVPPWRVARGPNGTVHCVEVRGGALPEALPGSLAWTRVPPPAASRLEHLRGPPRNRKN